MKKYELQSGKVVLRPRSKALPAFILTAVFFYISVKVTGFDMGLLKERGIQFFVILGQMFPPKVSYTGSIWTPLIDTVKMSLLGSIIGSVAAMPVAVLASTNIVKNRGVVGFIRFILSIIRTLPTLVTALIATYVFGLGTLAGTTAIAVFTFAYVGKMLYEQIETVDMGAFEAMEAMGCSRFQAFLGAVLPQVTSSYLSVCLFCFEGNVRYASILGYVGAGGLGLILSEKVGWREYDCVGMILIMLFLTVLIIEAVSHFIRVRLS
ncbi:phosphonate transport system permease protein [Anaerocolumna jejuensis DSM 15929]|uniref:Phosphonate transport system permease protein n=1 Tax=Anaerocolumna jejuensis DSM 15929 TaxID=1121322 RepID=A0A1M6M8C8_9FIRM|nr:phosphonate ABC transporter, permease protein PhnE [Anaerocolumna jejuensis]SHJ79650.1 phosphonate transport system permease protein [Anaerocolumna jejuensis DSM 15929]